MSHKILLIAGNGLTISYYEHHRQELDGWHPSQPLTWPIPNPTRDDQALLDALPNLKRAIGIARANADALTDFEVFRRTLEWARAQVDDNAERLRRSMAEIEARHYLALAYSHLHSRIANAGPNDWPWASWLAGIQQCALYAVSLNYDLLLELALLYSGRVIALGSVETGTVVFKPHGSINYDLASGMMALPLGYPLQFASHLNDGPITLLSADTFLSPRQEPVCVLPTESSPFTRSIWNRGRFQEVAGIAPQATHCVIVGISYHDADRPELRFILDHLAPSAQVHVVDPFPSEALLSDLRTRGFAPEVSATPPMFR